MSTQNPTESLKNAQEFVNSETPLDQKVIEILGFLGEFAGRSYSGKGLQTDLSSLTAEQKENFIKSTENYVGTIKSAIVEEIPFGDDRALLKHWLKRMQLKSPFDTDLIGSDDILEVYHTDFVQVYRNKTFYNFCSYDPLTMATHPYFKLFKRDPKVDEVLFGKVSEVLNAEEPQCIPFNTPSHTIQEHFAKNCKVFEIQNKYIAPLISEKTKERIGFVCTLDAKYLGDSNVSGMGKVH